MDNREFLRRIAPFGLLLFFVSALALFRFLGEWHGKRGEIPAGRVYLPLKGTSHSAIAEAEIRVVDGHGCLRLTDWHAAVPADTFSQEACQPTRLLLWKNALLRIELDSPSVAVSVVGGDFSVGQTIGSNADPGFSDGPPVPLRGYGVPGIAAVVVRCHVAAGSICLHVEDRLGRMSIQRGDSVLTENPLHEGTDYPLLDGDRLWMGLASFAVATRPGERVRLARVVAASGDPDWLSETWPIERPDSISKDGRFWIFPLEARYRPNNLSPERVDLETEDEVQRLIDLEWLCFNRQLLTVQWLPPYSPGCQRDGPSPAPSKHWSESAVLKRYQAARHGPLASVVARLLETTNQQLLTARYVGDGSVLPLAFEWRLRHWNRQELGALGINDYQPFPHILWGIRFGALRTRFVRDTAIERGMPPIELRSGEPVAITVRGKRWYSDDLYARSGLQDLIGNALGLTGIEAALLNTKVDALPQHLRLTISAALQREAYRSVAATMNASAAAVRESPVVSAVILDAHNGEVLSVVDWKEPKAQGLVNRVPSAWDLATRQVRDLGSVALMRNGHIGSAAKVLGLYALANNAGSWTSGGPTGAALGRPPISFGHSDTGGQSTPINTLGTCTEFWPLSATLYSLDQVTANTAQSCNPFFIALAFRFLSWPPTPLRTHFGADAMQGAITDLTLERISARARPTARQRRVPAAMPGFLLNMPDSNWAYEAVASGLAHDSDPDSIPRTAVGLLLRAGWKPLPEANARARAAARSASWFEMLSRGNLIRVPLVDDWFDAHGGPRLVGGRDFTYPGVLAPGAVLIADDTTASLERFGGDRADTAIFTPRSKRRDARDFAQVFIGQGSFEASALALAVLYAPLARADGRVPSPCLILVACHPIETARRFLDPSQRRIVMTPLRAVLEHGSAAKDARQLVASGWVGKTGTFVIDTIVWSSDRLAGMSWEDFIRRACGVTDMPVTREEMPEWTRRAHADDAIREIVTSPPGLAGGAHACDTRTPPTNPGGIQSVRSNHYARELDRIVAARPQDARTKPITHYAMAIVRDSVAIALIYDGQSGIRLRVQLAARLAAVYDAWNRAGRH